jgi:urea transporter
VNQPESEVHTSAPKRPSSMKLWVSPLTGVGQIMFQDSSITGLFFLLGIAVASPITALGGLVGAIIGTLCALVFRFNRKDIEDGLYGFNASLVGLAILFRFQPSPSVFGLILIGSIAATLLTYLMRTRIPFPTYTAPFIIVTWVVYFIASQIHAAAVVAAGHPENLTEGNFAFAVLTGVSEVMFQANILTGALFLTGILLCSPRMAGWAVVGSMVGLLAGIAEHAPGNTLGEGLYGYNGALAAMAMALYRPSLLLPIVAASLSAPITDRFPQLGVATLTAPFVLSCWFVIAIDHLDRFIYHRDAK